MKRRVAQGSSWQALLTEDTMGIRGYTHFSVSGRFRKPTDAEVEEAREALQVTGLIEIQNPVNVNPYVRHFVPLSIAQRFGHRVL